MEKADKIAVILIGLLILSVIYAIYGICSEVGQISVIKESIAHTESLPEQGYFNVTATITEYKGRHILGLKPLKYNYIYSTNKGITLEFWNSYDIGTKIILLGYRDSGGINILSKEVIS